jgi:hypothetical protein
MDPKYGRIFTEDDVRQLVERAGTDGLANSELDALISGFEGKFGDEPVFTLRAQDNAALRTIEDYWNACTAIGCSSDHLDNIHTARDAFMTWQQAHPDKVKVPD